jgi:hypothetical protein
MLAVGVPGYGGCRRRAVGVAFYFAHSRHDIAEQGERGEAAYGLSRVEARGSAEASRNPVLLLVLGSSNRLGVSEQLP